mmetsp:Transcript_6136/g.13438  ORF Transcript_6136/g.13438 Transcript_6136/m.13438 type:complete len:267 (+) Transcript_6136:298-1098(+)
MAVRRSPPSSARPMAFRMREVQSVCSSGGAPRAASTMETSPPEMTSAHLLCSDNAVSGVAELDAPSRLILNPRMTPMDRKARRKNAAAQRTTSAAARSTLRRMYRHTNRHAVSPPPLLLLLPLLLVLLLPLVAVAAAGRARDHSQRRPRRRAAAVETAPRLRDGSLYVQKEHFQIIIAKCSDIVGALRGLQVIALPRVTDNTLPSVLVLVVGGGDPWGIPAVIVIARRCCRYRRRSCRWPIGATLPLILAVQSPSALVSWPRRLRH